MQITATFFVIFLYKRNSQQRYWRKQCSQAFVYRELAKDFANRNDQSENYNINQPHEYFSAIYL